MAASRRAVHLAGGLGRRERVALDAERIALHADHDRERGAGLSLAVLAVAERLREWLGFKSVGDAAAEAMTCHFFRHRERNVSISCCPRHKLSAVARNAMPS